VARTLVRGRALKPLFLPSVARTLVRGRALKSLFLPYVARTLVRGCRLTETLRWEPIYTLPSIFVLNLNFEE